MATSSVALACRDVDSVISSIVASEAADLQLLIIKQRRYQSFSHVPLYIVSQHTKEDVSPHMRLGATRAS
jgi:hypothetical protein